jgi:hypothetical protein
VRLEPTVEVELPAAAVALAARGVGDALVSRPLIDATGLADRVTWASLAPRNPWVMGHCGCTRREVTTHSPSHD